MWCIAAISVGLVLLAKSVAAQSPATIPRREITLKQALEEVQRRTGYIVIVNYDNIPVSGMVAMPPEENLGAEEFARRVLSGTGFTAEVVGRRILVVPEPPALDDGEGAFGAIWRSTGGDGSADMEIVTFRSGSAAIDAGFMGNSKVIEYLDISLADTATVARLDHISVTAASSPDGSTLANEKLALRRAQNTKGYLEKRYPHIAPEKVRPFSVGEEWSGLRRLIARDDAVPEREAVLALLDTISPDADIRGQVGRIADGRTWRYISANLLPHLRGAAAITLHLADPNAEKSVDTLLRVAEPEGVAMADVQRVEFATEPPAPVVEPPAPEPPPAPKPLFAIKTNAPMDLASAFNLEIEVPVGERWSFAAEAVFPWWAVGGTLEARRWLGDRTERPIMTGWFAGVYFGGGTYDMKWNSRLHDGHYLHAGFSGGYAHAVSRSGNMRMEYSLGVGYLGGTDRMLSTGERKTLKWFGPTRAKVSIVWMIDRKQSGK